MSDFDAVYEYVRTIPAGRVTSYGAVGAEIGLGPREVGWAMNIAPKDVPWQRVVGADGYLRIAKRDPHLRALQQSLLEGEGVALNDKGCVERRFFLGEETAEKPEKGKKPNAEADDELRLF